jgi:hypothetical protein
MLLLQSSLLLQTRNVAVELFQAGLNTFKSPLDFVEPIFYGPEANVNILPELITLPDDNQNVHHHAEDDRKHWYADCEVQLLVGHLTYPH